MSDDIKAELSAFITARIREEENRADRWAEEAKPWGAAQVIDLTLTPGPAQVLAWSAATSRIVIECGRLEDYDESVDGFAEQVLRNLAYPYAWHRDYRYEWRPDSASAF